MGQVTAMPEGQCEHVHLLLPWYVAGTADDRDRDVVERHLGMCAACRAEHVMEQQLAAAISAEPSEVETGWSALGATLDREADVPPVTAAASSVRVTRDRRRWTRPLTRLTDPRALRWVAGVQFCVLAAMAIALSLPPQQDAPYHALGEATVSERRANILVMFDPSTSEALFRKALSQSGARLVDGPTAGGAYMLDVADNDQARALARLRATAGVTMAEPIGGGVAE